MTTDLKPCPFCGGSSATPERDPIDNYRWRVFCHEDECHAHGPSRSTKREAIAAWNTRASEDTHKAVLAERERWQEAVTLIERIYYMEGKDAGWRAAHMNGISRDVQDGKDLAPHRRLFPRNDVAAVRKGGEDG